MSKDTAYLRTEEPYNPNCIIALAETLRTAYLVAEHMSDKSIKNAPDLYDKVLIGNDYVDVLVMRDRTLGMVDVFYHIKLDRKASYNMYNVVASVMIQMSAITQGSGLGYTPSGNPRSRAPFFSLPDADFLAVMQHEAWTAKTTEQFVNLLNVLIVSASREDSFDSIMPIMRTMLVKTAEDGYHFPEYTFDEGLTTVLTPVFDNHKK